MNNMYNLYIPLCSLVLGIFLIILFLTKVKSFKNSENRFYFIMIVDVLIMTLMCILAIHSIYKGYSDSFIVSLANRIECFVIFNYVFSLYMYIVSCCKYKIKENNRLYVIINLIAFLLIMLLPISLDINKELTYMVVVGSAVNMTVLLSAISLLFTFVLALKNYTLLKEKIIPVIMLTLFLGIVMLIRQSIPEFICMEFLISLATLIMYHTIENPDLQIVGEYHEIKVIAKKQNIDKVMFLHRLNQCLKYDLLDLERNINYLSKEIDYSKYRECLSDMDYQTQKMLNLLTKVYDPNLINESEIKPFNNSYETKVYESIFKGYRSIIPNNIDYNYEIDSNLPEFLDGDIFNIKDILKRIIKETIDNIKEGYIKIKLSTVIDNNVCRLIIKISDNGEGYSFREIEDSLKNGLFKQYNDDLSKINGIMLVNSDKMILTEKIIVIDEIISLKDVKKLDKLEHKSSKKKVMVVDDSKISDSVIKILKKYDVEVIKVLYGVECLNKIRDYEKYDLIIINDEIQPINGIDTYKKLKENVSFKIPVIMLSQKKDFKIKEMYLKLGVNDIVSIPIIKEEMVKILDIYLKNNE